MSRWGELIPHREDDEHCQCGWCYDDKEQRVSAEIVAFIRARFNEDAEVARKAPPGPWIGTDAEDVGAWSVYDQEWLIASAKVYGHDKPMGGKRGPGYIDASATTAHIARHDPARVLREVDAKRRILDLHARAYHQCVAEDGPTQWHAADPCATLRLLASVYADRPGYRAEWRP